MNLEGARKFILKKMEKELDPRLAYHSVEHTLDVYDAVNRLAEMEGVDNHEMNLLKTAAIYHDCGMLRTYIGHEEAGTEIVQEVLPGFSYGQQDIEVINNMIMTTKLPQNAMTLQEMILCDADLDYLGRNDFQMISMRLKYEWDVLDIKPTTLKEWYQIQIQFLESHRYFTASAIALRQDLKEKHLSQIQEICSL
jgi:uncharacterized protein